ncbi:MAG: response regulator [bacterium]
MDPDPLCGRIQCEYLRGWRLRGEAYSSARDALAALTQGVAVNDPFRLVLCNSKLDTMDGTTFNRKLKEELTLSRVPFVLTGSSPLSGNRDELAAQGIAAFLAKPIRPQALLTMLYLSGQMSCSRSEALAEDLEVGYGSYVIGGTSGGRPAPSTPTQVLLVEDSPTNQVVARRILETIACRVDVVCDGQEALVQLAVQDYDLIIMDCQMPVLDGYQTTRRIRQQEGKTRHTPIIAITANALREDRDLCLAAGMDDYIAKPITPKSLQRVIDRWRPAGVRSG